MFIFDVLEASLRREWAGFTPEPEIWRLLAFVTIVLFDVCGVALIGV